MVKMARDEIEEFLQEARHAVVATNRGDGPPQISPVWYIYENGQFYISTSERSAKVQNLRRDPRISVCVDGGREDTRYVVLTGTVQIVPNNDPLQKEMRWRIIQHYVAGEQAAREYHDSTADMSQVLLVVRPEQQLSRDFR